MLALLSKNSISFYIEQCINLKVNTVVIENIFMKSIGLKKLSTKLFSFLWRFYRILQKLKKLQKIIQLQIYYLVSFCIEGKSGKIGSKMALTIIKRGCLENIAWLLSALSRERIYRSCDSLKVVVVV